MDASGQLKQGSATAGVQRQLGDPDRRAAVKQFLPPASSQINSAGRLRGRFKRRTRICLGQVGTVSPRHFLLIRKHLDTGELAYHYCYVPPSEPIQAMTLVRAACLRWPVEEDFEFGTDQFGRDQSQVRLCTALVRHIVLTMAALVVCAITAAQAKTWAPASVLPHAPADLPPSELGVIALTVAEIKRLFTLLTRRIWPDIHHRARLRRHHQPA
ncbi:hypothetical protein [Fodinicola acaciae]|uniref:hypothetical protein n=1 Tax=Fodinicola acaciae TaxID=2681555 RepID=UPI0013D637F5|nr:hypothetical protein [Fodinicola acaciae]